jgi:hypothetical protein
MPSPPVCSTPSCLCADHMHEMFWRSRDKRPFFPTVFKSKALRSGSIESREARFCVF